MTIQEALIFSTNQLKPVYANESSFPARWMVSWVTGLTDAELMSKQNQELSSAQAELLTSTLLAHVQEHKPLAYIFGSITFLDLSITVRPPILIPRPETEYLCSLLIEKLHKLAKKDLVILDMCTGSGCIALALAKALPQADVYAVDISLEACALAQENAQKNDVPIHVINSDLFSKLPEIKFDLIVSNPPYIGLSEWETVEESVKKWEDPRALLAQEEGLYLLKKIISQAPAWLTGMGELAVEIGYNQGKLVHDIFIKAGFTSVVIHTDPWGKERFVTGEFRGNGCF